jgi:hypothetical protein
MVMYHLATHRNEPTNAQLHMSAMPTNGVLLEDDMGIFVAFVC